MEKPKRTYDSPHEAYKEIEPVILQLVRMMHNCPIDDAGKTGLAMLVTVSFFTTLCLRELERQKRPAIITRAIMDDMAGLMVEAMTARPKLELVDPPTPSPSPMPNSENETH